MRSGNPYQSPRADAETRSSSRNTNWLVVRIVLGFGVAAFAGMATWIGLLISFFAESTEYWPGWACAVPAVVVAGGAFWVVAFFRFGRAAVTPDTSLNRQR